MRGNFSTHILPGGEIIHYDDGDPNVYVHEDNISRSRLDACNRAGDTACGGRAIGREHNKCEVAAILRDYVQALQNNPLRFAVFFSRKYPREFDFKLYHRNDVYEVEGQWVRADEFGNYTAGYAGMWSWGTLGLLGMRAGGIAYAMTPNSGEHWDDRESAPMLNAGAGRAFLDDRSWIATMHGAIEKPPPPPGGPMMNPVGCGGN